MIKVGLTGGIGSGKTTVARVFQLLGIAVYSADAAGKRLMVSDVKLVDSIMKNFGRDVYDPQNNLDRGKLAAMVFNDSDRLKLLNSFVHPAVINDFELWVNQQTGPYVLKESALLFESGTHQLNDINIVVTAPEKDRIERVMKRDQITTDAVKDRMGHQFSDDKKTGLADYLIVNDNNSMLIPQVLSIHQKLLTLFAKDA